jgi:1,4-dihydroxy-2-naphthoyl-CoA hydrolase
VSESKSETSNGSIFQTRSNTRFRDADPAQILFFSRAYEIAHDAYEDFVKHLGFDWKDWFANATWAAPIRHSSCEHLGPIPPGTTIETKVTLEKIGDSSFTARYTISSADKEVARVDLVHVFIDKTRGAKLALPQIVRERLETYQSKSL